MEKITLFLGLILISIGYSENIEFTENALQCLGVNTKSNHISDLHSKSNLQKYKVPNIYKIFVQGYDSLFAIKCKNAVGFKGYRIFEPGNILNITEENKYGARFSFSESGTYYYKNKQIGCFTDRDISDTVSIEKKAFMFLENVFGEDAKSYIKTLTGAGTINSNRPCYFNFVFAKMIDGRILTDKNNMINIEIGEYGHVISFKIQLFKYEPIRSANLLNKADILETARKEIPSVNIYSQSESTLPIQTIGMKVINGINSYFAIGRGNDVYLVPHKTFTIVRDRENAKPYTYHINICEDSSYAQQ